MHDGIKQVGVPTPERLKKQYLERALGQRPVGQEVDIKEGVSLQLLGEQGGWTQWGQGMDSKSEQKHKVVELKCSTAESTNGEPIQNILCTANYSCLHAFPATMGLYQHMISHSHRSAKHYRSVQALCLAVLPVHWGTGNVQEHGGKSPIPTVHMYSVRKVLSQVQLYLCTVFSMQT